MIRVIEGMLTMVTPAQALSAAPEATHFSATVASLVEANSEFLRGPRKTLGRRALPSRDALRDVVRGIRAALFPWHFGGSDFSPAGASFFVGHTLETALSVLSKQVRIGMLLECTHMRDRCSDCERSAAELVETFSTGLPRIREYLGADAEAAYSGDPAATSRDEVIFCYPGMEAILHHRIAHELHALGAPLIARIISQLAHSQTGIDIHPAATIGPSFFVDHGTGVVIGETCRVGQRVRIYQGVTLGARDFPTDDEGHVIKGLKRHPDVGDDVQIYAGATILGPIRIGSGAIIGGNVWLTRDVEAHAKVVQPPTAALRVSSKRA